MTTRYIGPNTWLDPYTCYQCGQRVSTPEEAKGPCAGTQPLPHGQPLTETHRYAVRK